MMFLLDISVYKCSIFAHFYVISYSMPKTPSKKPAKTTTKKAAKPAAKKAASPKKAATKKAVEAVEKKQVKTPIETTKERTAKVIKADELAG